ncbi:MAG: hypothetical protein DRZ76_03190 [Candidatus Nealsonbacteria bacterium]|nr:MAG: hypothetical protein DRZ76_03190 [Candidatus Nealsonbacteria bacterium]
MYDISIFEMAARWKMKESSRFKMIKQKISGLKAIDDYLPFALIVICVVSATFIENNLYVFLVFIMALVAYVWRRYDVRIFVGIAIFLLVACIVLLAFGYESQADKVAVWAYYFLVNGAAGLFIDYLREEKKKGKGENYETDLASQLGREPIILNLIESNLSLQILKKPVQGSLS